MLEVCGSSLLWRFPAVGGVGWVACQGFLVREACIGVLVDAWIMDRWVHGWFTQWERDGWMDRWMNG